MKRYAEYKDSGIEWIGEIPSEWDVKKLKFFAKICNGQDYKSVAIEEGGYPVMGSGGEFTRASTFMYDKPSVLLGRKGTIDKPLFIEHPFWTVDTMYYTKINENTSPKFLYYLSTTIYFDFYRYGSAVPSMTQDDLNNIYFTTPKTSEEQQKIVTHLDYITAAIDELIADKQKLVALLQEKRAAIISEAVTKGLDKTAKMKDSGVEWIGEIPNNWILTKFKYFTSKIGSGKTPKGGNEVYADEGIVFVRSQNVHNTGLFLDDVAYITTDMDKDLANTRLELNDVLLNVTGASIGRSCIWEVEGIQGNVNQHVCIIRSNGNAIPPYIHYVLISNIGQTFIDSCQTGANRQGLNFEQIANFTLPLPKFEEQQTIVTYLDQKTTRIDVLISDINKQIEKLKEYRQAIISEVVTGKVAV